MEHILEIIGTVVGILYLWLEYRASIYLWIAGIIMPAVYIFVYYDAGLYADFGINIYYLGAAIYGWMMWKYGAFLRRTILRRKGAGQKGEDTRTEEQKLELPITHMPARYLRPTLVGTLYPEVTVSIFPYPSILRRSAWHCLDIDKLHGQQCALAGLLHHRTEHSRHVDAGTEICRAMVGMDCGRCR